jgi:hypothetical protein
VDTCPYCNSDTKMGTDTKSNMPVAVCPTCGKPLTAAAMAADLKSALSSLTAIGTEKTALTEQVTALTAEKTTLAASIETLTADKDKAEKLAAEQKETLRRNAVGARMTDETWGKKKATILAMAEDAFATMLELAPAAAQPAKPAPVGIALGSGQTETQEDGKIKIVMG